MCRLLVVNLMTPPDSSESNRQNETTDRTIKRLQARIAGGAEHLRADLAEALLQAAQETAIKNQFETSLKRIDEALNIIRQLVKEGQFELNIFIGRVLLFRAAIIRFHTTPEAGVNAFNEAIRHIVEMGSDGDAQVQNELATALMSKADILIEPLGAYAAALASQEQAAKIWQHLLDHGEMEFRPSLVNALMSCGDSKMQNGDAESAIRELKHAVEIAEEGVEAGELLIQPYYIQSLLKLARLYDQENDMEHAFETVRSAIRTIKNLIADGIDQAQMMFTTLYLHLGMLYEKIRDSEAALAEYNRCRDVYTEIFREQNWGAAESYAFRTGLANVLMCRGNMLADLKRYSEAEEAFEESVWQYQQAAEYKPPEDSDETLILYSIGVVQLNHANMLVVQDKYEEAVELKKKALKALKQRMDAGHDEILPNYLAANQKLVSIRKAQNDGKQVLALLNHAVKILEKTVDEGKLEYRIDLAMTYRQRSIQRDELLKLKPALDDSMKALRLFRMIADDDRDISDVHVAKVQWSELLHQIAVLSLKNGKNDDAFDFLKKEIVDLIHFYEEGNGFVVADLVLGYTQYIDFVETFGNHLEQLKYPVEKFAVRVREVQNLCKHGIELSLQQQTTPTKDLIAKLFFMMKTAFFHKADGVLHRLLEDNESACRSFATSMEHWHLLLGGLENLKAKARYDAAERGEPMPNWDIPGGTNDPYQDRYIFYMNELRETMQLGAKAHLACNRLEKAEELYEKENALTRELAKKGIPNADRFLVVSLTAHARNLEEKYPVEKTKQLFDETLRVLHKRFESGDVVAEDFWVLRRVCRDYLGFLQEKKLPEDAFRISENTVALLEKLQTFPPSTLWMAVCVVLDMHSIDGSPSENALKMGKRYRKLLKRHPDFKTDKDLKRYDRALKARLDEVTKKILLEQSVPPEPQSEGKATAECQ